MRSGIDRRGVRRTAPRRQRGVRRSCLIQLVVLVVAAVAVLWLALPVAAGALALTALQAGGFSGTATSVDVAANPPLVLLVGHADRLRIRSTDASLGDLHAAGLDLTLADVDLFARRAVSIDGALSGVSLPAVDGATVTAARVSVHGLAGSAAAIAEVDTEGARELAVTALRVATGLSAGVTLTSPNRLSVAIPGRQVGARLVVESGALVLRPDSAALPVVTLLRPGAGQPFRLTGVSVTETGLALQGTIDVNALLG